MIEKKPFRGVKLPKVSYEKHRCWTEKEAAMFLTFLMAAKKSKHYAIFYVALATRLRIDTISPDLGRCRPEKEIPEGIEDYAVIQGR